MGVKAGVHLRALSWLRSYSGLARLSRRTGLGTGNNQLARRTLGWPLGNAIERIAREIQAIASIRATVQLVEPRSLERFTGKAKRVIDKRGLTA